MGTSYTVACCKCRVALDIGKNGSIFCGYTTRHEGDPSDSITADDAVKAMESGEGYWPEEWSPVLERWIRKHEACGRVHICNDSGSMGDGVYELKHEDEVAGREWPEPFINDLIEPRTRNDGRPLEWRLFVGSAKFHGYTAAQCRRLSEIADLTSDLRPPTVQPDDSGTMHVSFMGPAYSLMFEVEPDGSGSWFFRDVQGFVRKGDPGGTYGEDIAAGRDLACGFIRFCVGLSAGLQSHEVQP